MRRNVGRIQIVSDLHLERYGHEPPDDGSFEPDENRDLLILAGDIGTGLGAYKFIDQELERSPVVYVLGNHEHYVAETHGEVEAEWARIDGYMDGLHVLQAEAREVAGWRIWGGPAYSDLWDDDTDTTRRTVEESITDFADGVNDRRMWSVKAHVRECRRQVRRMERHAGAVDIVVTHWPATLGAIDPQFMVRAHDRALNRYFVNDWDDRVERMGAALWVSGHTHTPHDLMVRGTRCVSNPRGYRDAQAHPRYRPTFTLEVERRGE